MMETIASKKKELDELMHNGFIEKTLGEYPYRFTLKDGKVTYSAILEDGTLRPLDTRNLDEYKNDLDKRIYFANFIEDLFKSVGIVVGSIENDYYILTEYHSRIYGKKDESIYTFIELLINPRTCQALRLNLVKFDMNTRALSFDRIDLERLKHYHTDSEISEYTYNEFRKHEAREHWYLSHNDLYDVRAVDAPTNYNGCAYVAMQNYGNLAQNLDVEKLDKRLCKVKNAYNPNGTYYSTSIYYTQETKY